MESNTEKGEYSVRQFMVELEGVKDLLKIKFEFIKELLEEREKLYIERNALRASVVDNALLALEKQTKASFDSSDKAMVKTEEAQREYNHFHNDLMRKLDDQNKSTMSRTEIENRFKALEDRFIVIREEKGQERGKSAGMNAMWGYTVAVVTIIIGFVSLGVLVHFSK